MNDKNPPSGEGILSGLSLKYYLCHLTWIAMRRIQTLKFLTVFSLLFVSLRAVSQDIPFDCEKARVLTNKNSVIVDGTSFGGNGSFEEPGSCFTSAERDPYWFQFEVCQSGTLVAYVDPEGTADFDFVLFDITNGCQARTQVACNYNSSVGVDNITGIGCDNPPFCEPEVDVIAGHVYGLAFNRSTLGSQAGFTLTLGGTCGFYNPAELNFIPSVNDPGLVCGLTGEISGVVNAAYDNVEWTATGPGTVVFNNSDQLSTNFDVSVAGTYRFYLAASKIVCGSVVALIDSIDVVVKGITPLYGDGEFRTCESSVELTSLLGKLSGNPPSGGYWTDDSTSGRIDANGLFNAYGAGGNVYSFTYHTSSNDDCDVTQASVQVTVVEELKVQVDSVPCFNSGTNFRVYTFISGGEPATYKVNGTGQANPYFTSGFLPNKYNYSFEISDLSGCPSVFISGTKDCNCTTNAGTLLDSYSVNCTNLSATVTPVNAPQIGFGNVLNYLVYTNTSNPIGSVVLKSTTAEIALQTPLVSGMEYYVSAAVGEDMGNGLVDLTDTCLSLSNGVKVRFPGNTTVELSGDTTICEDGMAVLKFNYDGVIGFAGAFTENGDTVPFFLKPGVTLLNVSPVITSVYDFGTLKDIHGCSVNHGGSVTVQVKPAPSFSYQLVNDSVVCETQSGSPFMIFNTEADENLNVSYSINNVSQPDYTNVGNFTLVNVPKKTNGKHTLQVNRIESTVTGCVFNRTYPAINYYYLDAPTISISNDGPTEFCTPGNEAQITFHYEGNLPVKVYYRINSVIQEVVLDSTTEFDYPVTENLNFVLDSVKFRDFDGCTFPLTGSTSVTYFKRPVLTIDSTHLTCVNDSSVVTIYTNETGLSYRMNGGDFNQNTVYYFTTPGNKLLEIKRGVNCIYDRLVEVVKIDTFKLFNTVTDTKCGKANGQIVPELTGSFEIPVNYSFNGSPVNTNLPSGSYTVVATDATGCSVSKQVEIMASPLFVFTATPLDTADCSIPKQGSVVLAANGGGGVTFTFSTDGVNFTAPDTVKNQDPTFHWYYAKNEVGCLDSLYVKVKAKVELNVNVDLLNYLKCYDSHDAKVKLTVSNATTELRYAHFFEPFVTSNEFSDLGPGNQTFYVEEVTGCKRGAMVSFNLSRPDELKLKVVAKGNPICFNSNDGFIVMSTTGGGTLSYRYTVNGGSSFYSSPNIGGLAPGDYTLFSVNENQCYSDTLFLTLVSTPPIFIDNVETSFNPDGTTGNITITASGGTAPLLYSVNGSNYSADNVFNNLPKGVTYQVSVKDSNSCIVKQDVLLDNVGMAESTLQVQVSIYPNPTKGTLNVEFGEVVYGLLRVKNSLGQIVTTKGIDAKVTALDVNGLPGGIYFLSVETNKGNLLQKIIRN